VVALNDRRSADLTRIPAAGTVQFCIGICATGESPTLVDLIDSIGRERFPAGFSLRKVIVVASACGRQTLRFLEKVERLDPRVLLIREDERRGKARAINLILEESVGEYLVMVNADAVPSPGAMSRLLRSIERDESIGMVSGIPKIDPGRGIAANILDLMWETANTCSQDLNPTHLSNHGTDELMVVRSDAVASIPDNVVNDGAYIAGRLRRSGFRVRSVAGAGVRVDVPSRPVEIISQRRRILYGHIQVRKLVGRAPVTAESLMVLSPHRGFGALVRTVAKHPKLLAALPFAAACEFISFAGAILDSSRGESKHAVWERYAD
jgi:cellulose synthase/poly-beta-1,6-N-acetylglucosamine synthase-like glycosyltransferase